MLLLFQSVLLDITALAVDGTVSRLGKCSTHMLAWLSAAFLGMWLASLSLFGGGENDNTVELEKAKAIYIASFLNSTTWPDNDQPNTGSLVFGILGTAPFGEPYLSQFKSTMINGRSIIFTFCTSAADVTACHAIYIGQADRKLVMATLKQLKGASVLSIGESEDFTKLGGIIRFTLNNSRYKFEYNKEAYRRSRLKIDSRILGLGSQS